MENAKIALIQFCVSPPKTDMENSIVINDYTQMDRHVSVCLLTGSLRIWVCAASSLTRQPPA